MVIRVTFKERNDCEFQPYKSSNKIINILKKLFGMIVLRLLCIMVLQRYVSDFIFCLQLVQ